MSVSQNFPTISPSLSLDFANVQALDPRITFSRATTATYYGTRTALAEQNLFQYSQEFDNAYWSKQEITVTANSTTAPDGTTTAELAVPTITNINNHAINRAYTWTASSHTLSVYAKSSGYQYFMMAIFDGAFKTCVFDLTGGTVTQTFAGVSTLITSVGSGWYRCSMTFTPSAASGFVYLGAVNASTWTYGTTSFAGDGTSGVFLWGAQLEQRSSVTAYTPTTTQPVTNYIPVLETAASNVARFDHNPVTFESLGLLIEEQRTNLVLRSEELNVSPWTQTSVTVSANQIIAPDGTLTGDKIISTSGSIGTIRQSSITVTNGAPYTLSCIAKAGEHNSLVIFITDGVTARVATLNLLTGVVSDVSSGLTTTVTQLGNGWYRFSGSVASSGSTSISLRLGSTQTGDGYSGIYIWGAQLEAGAFATSYIPTVASQVTRAADSASMTGTNFTSWYTQGEGTLYSEASVLSLSQGGYRVIASIADNTSSETNLIAVGSQASTGRNLVLAGSSQADFTTGAIVANTPFKTILAYKVNDFASSINGSAASTDTTGVLPPVTQIFFGQSTSAGISRHNGTIKKIAYYPIRLSNTNLQALTG